MLVEQKQYAEAEPVLEKAVAINPDDARLLLDLGEAQMRLKMTEKALASFDRAIEIAPLPMIWNTVAYDLAEQNIRLDRAQRYGESAVAMLSAQLRNVRLDQLKQIDLLNVNLLAASWDTLGWVHFRKGEMGPAQRYLSAAWQLKNDGTTADHLGQVYERTGKRDLAIEYYSLAAADLRATPESHKHLAALVGEAKVPFMVAKQKDRLGTLRSYDMPGTEGDGSAEFFIALAPGPKVTEVRFVSGDKKLTSLATALKSVRFKMEFPDEGDARVIRRGILSCVAAEGKSAAGACAFILLKPEDVHSVN
jgi:Flp pilus assembly protein TadD